MKQRAVTMQYDCDDGESSSGPWRWAELNFGSLPFDYEFWSRLTLTLIVACSKFVEVEGEGSGRGGGSGGGGGGSRPAKCSKRQSTFFRRDGLRCGLILLF